MNEQNNSVKQLVERALNNDHEAFSKLYYQTYDRNYYLVLKLVKSEQDTEDILQDTYIKILEKLSQYQYKGESSFASWTSAIASNTALDFLRKKRPTLFSELSEDEEFIFDTEDESVDFQPEQQYDQKETAEIVSMILSELSEEQRICILLFYLQNLSIKEISEQCQCSKNTVKSRLNYGRKKIRGQADTLKKYGIHVGKTSMLAALVYFLQGDIAYANSITIVKAASGAAKVIALVSQSGGMATTVATETTAGVTMLSKTAATIGVKKIVAISIASVITLGGAGGYVVQKFKPFSSPASATVTAAPLAITPTVTATVAPMPTTEVTATPAPTDTPEPTKEVTEEPATEELVINEETNVPETKKPIVTVKPTKKPTSKPTEKSTKKPTSKPTTKPTKKPTPKPTAKPTKKPTPKPTTKPTEKPVEEDDMVEWDDVTVEDE